MGEASGVAASLKLQLDIDVRVRCDPVYIQRQPTTSFNDPSISQKMKIEIKIKIEWYSTYRARMHAITVCQNPLHMSRSARKTLHTLRIAHLLLSRRRMLPRRWLLLLLDLILPPAHRAHRRHRPAPIVTGVAFVIRVYGDRCGLRYRAQRQRPRRGDIPICGIRQEPGLCGSLPRGVCGLVLLLMLSHVRVVPRCRGCGVHRLFVLFLVLKLPDQAVHGHNPRH